MRECILQQQGSTIVVQDKVTGETLISLMDVALPFVFPKAAKASIQKRLPPESLMNAAEAASTLGVSVNSFRTLAARGDVPKPVMFEGTRYWHRQEIETLVDKLSAAKGFLNASA